MKKDKLHLNMANVDSYNVTWNLIMSLREPGKTTALCSKLIKLYEKKHKPSLIIRRLQIEITEAYLKSFETNINKFKKKEKQIKLYWKKGEIKDGIVDVEIEHQNGHRGLLFRVVALNIPPDRLKSIAVPNLGAIFFDEYILNTRRKNVKYLQQEMFALKELYSTNYRECQKGYHLKVYCFGNPYSYSTPFTSYFDVDINKLGNGITIVDKKKDYLICCYKMKEELKEWLLEHNPLYKYAQEDDEFVQYSLGKPINDSNYIYEPTQPKKYYLRFVFRVNNSYLGIFQNNDPDLHDYYLSKFWISIVPHKSFKKSRKIYAVDFSQLILGTQLITPDIKATLSTLKYSIARRTTSFRSPAEAHLIEDIIYSLIK